MPPSSSAPPHLGMPWRIANPLSKEGMSPSSKSSGSVVPEAGGNNEEVCGLDFIVDVDLGFTEEDFERVFFLDILSEDAALALERACVTAIALLLSRSALRDLYARGLSVFISSIARWTTAAMPSSSILWSERKTAMAALRVAASESLTLLLASFATFSAAAALRMPRGPAVSFRATHRSINSSVALRESAFFCFCSLRAVGSASFLSKRCSKLSTLPKNESRHLPTFER